MVCMYAKMSTISFVDFKKHFSILHHYFNDDSMMTRFLGFLL